MSGKLLARASAILLALMLTACGGDSSSTPLAGSPDGGGTPTSPEGAEAGDLQLIASPVQLETSANANSSITARVKDASGVLLAGIPVSFSVTDGGTLEVTQSETDQAGVATATLTTDGDARNRTLTVTAQSGSASDTVDVTISGTSLAISGPSSIALQGTAALRITLANADGEGLAGQPITLATNLGTLSANSVTTDSNGIVDIQLNGGSAGGVANITASAFSGSSTITTSRDVAIASDSFRFSTPSPDDEADICYDGILPCTLTQVTVAWLVGGAPVANGTPVQFSTTRGIFYDSNGTRSDDGIATTSGGNATIFVGSDNSGFATVTASDPNSGLSADLQFEFIAITPAAINVQAAVSQVDLGESTEIVAVVRDADNNLVKNQPVTFNIQKDSSGGRLSSSRDTTDSQGKATSVYTGGSTTSGRDGVEIEATVGGSISDVVTLTVARQALRLAIGTGNEIEEPDTVRYRKPYVAIVTDANGAPVPNANIELSVLPTGYRKGNYVISLDDTWTVGPTTFCAAEDANQNGQLDPGEDTNGNLSLEPTNSATTSAPSVVSAADGSADFTLLYPQSHCTWVQVELTATVRVDGSESVETAEFYLSCLASDLSDTDISPPGGTEGLYGSAQDCAIED